MIFFCHRLWNKSSNQWLRNDTHLENISTICSAFYMACIDPSAAGAAGPDGYASVFQIQRKTHGYASLVTDIEPFVLGDLNCSGIECPTESGPWVL